MGNFFHKLKKLIYLCYILIGDMSLVGTRPPTIDEFEKYTDPKIKRMRLTMVLKKTYEVKE